MMSFLLTSSLAISSDVHFLSTTIFSLFLTNKVLSPKSQQKLRNQLPETACLAVLDFLDAKIFCNWNWHLGEFTII